MRLNFRDIRITDKELIESYTVKAESRSCDLAFTNIYCWKEFYHSQIAIVEGFLVIRFLIDGTDKLGYMYPLGDGDASSILPLLEADAKQHNSNLRLYGVPKDAIRQIKLYNAMYAVVSSRAEADYIYTAFSLSSLSGAKLKSKRNFVKGFTQLYNYTYKPLKSDDIDECLEICRMWLDGQRKQDKSHEEEYRAIKLAFYNFQQLDLRGGCIRVDGKMVAFTYGSAINNNTFCIHVEKALPEYRGAYAAINKLFVENLPYQYIWINREEDMGLAGLRKAKLSYHPFMIDRKYRAELMNDAQQRCYRLWGKVFKEDVKYGFVDMFLMTIFSEERMLTIDGIDGEIASMLHIVPMKTEFGKTAYIFAVATDEPYRKRGYASQLMRQALERIDNEEYDATILIAADDALKEFYSKFGFVATEIPVQFDHEVDLGTGIEEQDLAMIRLRKASLLDGYSSPITATNIG